MSNGQISQSQSRHPALDVFKSFALGASSRDETISAFCDYIMTGMRGIPVPNPDLAKSVLLSESSSGFMGYPQIIQCVAVLLKHG